MSRISVNRKKVKLSRLFGIRARLVLLALILVGPLMLDRARTLETMRAEQVQRTSAEFAKLAEHSAEAQREVIASVQAVLKSAAHIYAAAAKVGHSCDIMRDSVQVELPWIRSLSVVGIDGTIRCSTLSRYVGLNISDSPYFQKSLETHDFILSDYMFTRTLKRPTVIAAYPAANIEGGTEAVMIAVLNLDWMSQIMSNLGGRPGVSAMLIDSTGTVLATPSDQASMVGHKFENPSLLPAISAHEQISDRNIASVSVNAADGSKHTMTVVRVGNTGAHLVLNINETIINSAVNREIRTAYLQLAFVCLFVLLGALVAAERIIVQPITMMVSIAQRFGRGDWSARATGMDMPSEFRPLARAFNAMAAKLGERERELIATNHRLTVMASCDMLSGLANRRGFQSRLDFEWLKAQQEGQRLALLMIDVDHFKLFNDTYGHPEGDACLARLGETLAGIAHETTGFAARYGGEEFCLLLPGHQVEKAVEIGEMVRHTVADLAIPHSTSPHLKITVSIGVACAAPSEAQDPRDLIEAADAALYAAKHRGRNAVVEHGFIRETDKDLSLAS